MTGKELINYLIENNMQEEEIFLQADGKINHLEKAEIFCNNAVLCGNKRTIWDNDALKAYFSQWFTLISYWAAAQQYKDGNRNILILLPDGTDRYVDSYDSEEDVTAYLAELRNAYVNGAYFGLEK